VQTISYKVEYTIARNQCL